jgi:hypothetical protein
MIALFVMECQPTYWIKGSGSTRRETLEIRMTPALAMNTMRTSLQKNLQGVPQEPWEVINLGTKAVVMKAHPTSPPMVEAVPRVHCLQMKEVPFQLHQVSDEE